MIEWNFMVIISVWVLVNINCHLSWKWMDKWLPALVINPLVWGLFFVNYNWLHITVNFFDSVCDIDFCDWSSSGSSGVFLYRSVWYHRTEVRIYLWLVVPRGGLIRQNSRQGGSVLHLPVCHLLCVGGALWNAWLDVSIDGNCLFGWFGSVSWRCSFCLWETHISDLSLMKR